MFGQSSFFRIIAIYLIAILFVIINISNIRVAGLSNFLPLFDLMMVFYFAVFKSVFPMWFIFLLGIWGDALNGSPLGVTSLCYIILIKFFFLLNHKMMIRENFNQIFQQFIVFCFLFLLMKWAILSIFSGTFYSIATPIMQLVLSSLFYVPMHRFFDYLSVKLLEE